MEEAIKRRITIGSKMQASKLQDEMVSRFNNMGLYEKAISNMVKTGDF